MKPISTTDKIVMGLILLAGALGLAGILTGCGTFGTNPGPPTKAEQLVFNTTTNYVPVVVPAYQTNLVTVTSYQTNVQGVAVTQYLTNVVPITVPAQTNLQPQYVETVKPNVASGIQAGGSILSTFVPGVGGMVSTGLTALLGLLAYLRSSKQTTATYNTASALTQEIETVRNFVRTLPNGTAYDTALVNFLQKHQAEEGVVQQVADILGKELSNNDAQVAAQQLSQTITALGNVNASTPIGTIVK